MTHSHQNYISLENVLSEGKQNSLPQRSSRPLLQSGLEWQCSWCCDDYIVWVHYQRVIYSTSDPTCRHLSLALDLILYDLSPALISINPPVEKKL